MTKPRSKDFMETLRKKVEAEYDLEKENLMKFFVQNNFSFEQSKELANTLNRAIFYIKKDHKKRRKLEKESLISLKILMFIQPSERFLKIKRKCLRMGQDLILQQLSN